METFHELLPGNLVFFHFYYNGTKEIELLDHTTELYRKNYISMENFTSGVQNLTKTFRDQTVTIIKKNPMVRTKKVTRLLPRIGIFLKACVLSAKSCTRRY